MLRVNWLQLIGLKFFQNNVLLELLKLYKDLLHAKT